MVGGDVVDAVFSLVLMLACAAPIGLGAAWFASRGPGALGGFFRPAGSPDLGWPRGVQEEDAPTWNWGDRVPPATRPALPDPLPGLVPELVDGPAERLPLRRVAGRLQLGPTSRRNRA